MSPHQARMPRAMNCIVSGVKRIPTTSPSRSTRPCRRPQPKRNAGRKKKRPSERGLNRSVWPASMQPPRSNAAQTPKLLTVDAVKAADVVITMGSGDTCPIFPGKRYEDWDLDDPAGQDLAAVRVIRDEIRIRVSRLVDELLEPDAASTR